jgi:hypothetical protein
MPNNDPVLTPELIRILKIFILSSLGLVLVFSFFNTYRAENTGEDWTFRITDANRIYFLNMRTLYYEREHRRDAGMTLYRHEKRFKSDSIPTLDPVILLNPKKDEAYIYFELRNADFPIRIKAKSSVKEQFLDFSNGNNLAHLKLFNQLKPMIEQNYSFYLEVDNKSFPLWSSENEKEVLKTIVEDYFRLLNQNN